MSNKDEVGEVYSSVSHLKDIRKSVSEMSQAELEARLLEVRKARRSGEGNPRTKVVRAPKVKTEIALPAPLPKVPTPEEIKAMSPAELLELRKQFGV